MKMLETLGDGSFHTSLFELLIEENVDLQIDKAYPAIFVINDQGG